MEKIDFKKRFSELYTQKKGEISIVDVPEMNFLMVDGQGDPNTSREYQEAVEALYSAAYQIKFTVKKGPLQADFAVMPMEGLWWTDDMNHFSEDRKDLWKWTMCLMQPEFVTRPTVENCLEEVKKKKDLPALPRIRFEAFHEGLSAQILHIGPYAEERPTIEKLHGFIRESGYILRDKHREIYLGDPRRSAPEKLKTIIRQPVARPQ